MQWLWLMMKVSLWSGSRRFSSSDSSFFNRSGRPVACFLHASEIWVKAPICWEKSKLLLWQYVTESIIWQAIILYCGLTKNPWHSCSIKTTRGRIKWQKFALANWVIMLTVLILCLKKVATIFRQTVFLKFHVPLPNNESLRQLHDALICHPGVTRLTHFISIRNLLYSIEDIKWVVSKCQILVQAPILSVRTGKPCQSHVTIWKALHWKRLLPSNIHDKYFLKVVDE